MRRLRGHGASGLAAYNETPVRFTGIADLRVKECDRISALAEGLNRIGPVWLGRGR